jgi:hypothetical protein
VGGDRSVPQKAIEIATFLDIEGQALIRDPGERYHDRDAAGDYRGVAQGRT